MIVEKLLLFKVVIIVLIGLWWAIYRAREEIIKMGKQEIKL